MVARMGASAEIQSPAQGLGARCASEKVRGAARFAWRASRCGRRASGCARATPQGGSYARCLCSARKAMQPGACRGVTRPSVNLSHARSSLSGARVKGTRRAGENGRRVGKKGRRAAGGGRRAAQCWRRKGRRVSAEVPVKPCTAGMGRHLKRHARLVTWHGARPGRTGLRLTGNAVSVGHRDRRFGRLTLGLRLG